MKLRQARKLVAKGIFGNPFRRPRRIAVAHKIVLKRSRMFRLVPKIDSPDARRYCSEVIRIMNSAKLRGKIRQQIDDFLLRGTSSTGENSPVSA